MESRRSKCYTNAFDRFIKVPNNQKKVHIHLKSISNALKFEDEKKKDKERPCHAKPFRLKMYSKRIDTYK